MAGKSGRALDTTTDGTGSGLGELWAAARAHRPVLVAAGALTLLATAAALAQPLAAKSAVDARGEDRGAGSAVLLLSALVVLSALSAGAGSWLLDRTGERVVRDIRRRLSLRLTRLRVAELDCCEQGDLVARATSDSNLMRTAATTGLVELVGHRPALPRARHRAERRSAGVTNPRRIRTPRGVQQGCSATTGTRSSSIPNRSR